jgi:hypothetical protein
MADKTHILTLLLDELIPPSGDGRLPSAGALGVAADVEAAVKATPTLAPVIEGGLTALEGLSRARSAGGFGALSGAERVAVLHELEGADPVFVPTLMMLAYVGYYGNDRVVAMLKPDANAPHPRGYEVEPDDAALLDPVRSRGKLYRDC